MEDIVSRVAQFDTAAEPSTAGQIPLRRRRLVRSGVAVVLLVVLAIGIASAFLFVGPSTDRVRPVDAILTLNGRDEGSVIRIALSLTNRGVAPVLLFSKPEDPPYCPVVANVQVVCFHPSPNRTVGEIDFAATYARQHHLHTILIIAGHTQTTRARLLAERCFPGKALVINTPATPTDLTYGVVYEWGALLKALVIDRGCS